MENSNENTGRSQGGKGTMALGGMAAVLFVVALGLGTAYFFKMEETSDLQRQVSELKAAAAKMDEEMGQDGMEPGMRPADHL